MLSVTTTAGELLASDLVLSRFLKSLAYPSTQAWALALPTGAASEAAIAGASDPAWTLGAGSTCSEAKVNSTSIGPDEKEETEEPELSANWENGLGSPADLRF